MNSLERAVTLSICAMLLGGCMNHHNVEKSCIYGDCKEGVGIERDDRGNLYVGNWSKGQRNGIGTLHQAWGDRRFFGNWQDGRKEGAGTMVLESGAISGNWLFNDPHGVMTYTGTDGTFSGYLGKDLSPEEGEVVWPSGERYRGLLGRAGLSGVPQGMGELELNGEVIRGRFTTRVTEPLPWMLRYRGEIVTAEGRREYLLEPKKESAIIVFEFKEVGPLVPAKKQD